MSRSETPKIDLCPDWVYSESSNVHVANNRAWFTSYHPFPSQLSCIYAIGAPFPVLGIGTIKLAVKSAPSSISIFGTSTIELHNVLHVPTYFCNVLGRPLSAIYQISLGGSARNPSRGGLALHGKQIAYFYPGPVGFFSLAVLPPTGTQFGPSFFRNGVNRVVSAYWPHEERVRWQAIQTQAKLAHEPPRYEPPYALHEVEYVNLRWGSEFRFLAQYGLKLGEERDRSEGRRIVRALMQGRDPKEKVEVTIEVEGKLRDYLLPDRGKGAGYARCSGAPRMPFFTQGWRAGV